MIAVGGCYAEAQRERIFELYPDVDVAFGPGSIAHLGEWLGAGGVGVARGRFGLDERDFAAELPMHRERAFQAWVQVSMGCNSNCSYCIVPAVRGREQSRRPGEIVAEVDAACRRGRPRDHAARPERQLVGPRPRARHPHRVRRAAARRATPSTGIERIRFTSPHPKDFREPVIAAIAECDAVCEHVHLPLQSGSSRHPQGDAPHLHARAVPRARRPACATAIPDLALGTDIIVGFPGETEDDFAADARDRRGGRFDSAFTFVYSPRHGTEAATMPDQVPHELKIERMERLVEVVQRIARERNAARVGGVEEVLVEGPSRTDAGAAARAHAPQHDGQLRRRRRGRASSSTSRIEARRRRRCAAARRRSPRL